MISNSFYTNLCKNLACGAHFQFPNLDFLKKCSLELNPLVLNNVQQNSLPELYPQYSPSYQKCSPSFYRACCPHHAEFPIVASSRMLPIFVDSPPM